MKTTRTLTLLALASLALLAFAGTATATSACPEVGDEVTVYGYGCVSTDGSSNVSATYDVTLLGSAGTVHADASATVA
jgi:hypothetical protein